MAEIHPFVGIRYDLAAVRDLGAVVAPPYDAISLPDQVRYHIRSPHNVIRLELGNERLSDTATENRYTRSVAHLRRWLAEGVLREEARPSLYVHEQEFFGGKRLAVHAAVRLEEWQSGIVLPHELTLDEPKEDRLQLLRATGLNTSPILALYEDPTGRIRELLDRVVEGPPVARFQDDAGERHRLWIVDDPAVVAGFAQAFRPQPLFIADGHHRYETALAYRNELAAAGELTGDHPANDVLMALVDLADPGLVVFPTHRTIAPAALGPEGLSDVRWATFLGALSEHFDIAEVPLAPGRSLDSQVDEVLGAMSRSVEGKRLSIPLEGRPSITLFARGAFRVLAPRPEAGRPGDADRSETWRRLDVVLLHDLVLRRLLDLPPRPPESSGVGYTRDPLAAAQAVVDGEAAMAFLLNPPPVHAIKEVSLAGDKMPQKSTYFYPKLPTGLVLKRVAPPTP